MENFKTVKRGNSRDTSDTSSDASLPIWKRCRWTWIRTCSPCPPRPNWARRPGTAPMSGFGRTSYENVVKPRRALRRHYPVNCIVVRPERRSNVANTLGRHLASEHHDPGAEAARCQAREAEAARGCPRDRTHRRVPWEIAIANHCNRFGAAGGRITISAASQAGEDV